MNAKPLIIALLALTGGLAAAASARAQEQQPAPEAPASQTSARIFQTSIAFPANIQAGIPFNADIQVQDGEGGTVADFDPVQGKTMHLIVVGADLGSFQHLFPEHQVNGQFKVELLLPNAGSYVLYCHYQPTGDRKQLALMEIATGGGAAAGETVPDPDTRQRIAGNTLVALTLSPQPVRAGQETTLLFELSQAENLRPVEGLSPYLGSKGHLVAIRKSAPLTIRDYLATKVTEEGGESAIQFTARFPEPGLYRLWCEFDLGGSLHAADFWIQVE
ncbi:MAG: hypothetical protein JXB25_00750 [Deltaproteobacteria bacterium]|nr:hypothetical protein [Deltaproteobacteria bacterium]